MIALLSQAQLQLPPQPTPRALASLLFSCARLGAPLPPALLAAAADGVALAGEGGGGGRQLRAQEVGHGVVAGLCQLFDL